MPPAQRRHLEGLRERSLEGQSRLQRRQLPLPLRLLQPLRRQLHLNHLYRQPLHGDKEHRYSTLQ